MKKSLAAASLAKWVLAIDSLYKLLRNIEDDWVQAVRAIDMNDLYELKRNSMPSET